MLEDYHTVAHMMNKRLQGTCKDKCIKSPFGPGWNKDGLKCDHRKEYERIYPQIKAGIPMEFIQVNGIRPEAQDQWKKFKKLIGNVNKTVTSGIGFCVWGELHGVGKTTFTCEFLKLCLQANFEGYYIHIKKFQDYVFMFHDKQEQDYRLKKILHADVLVIDGLGEEYEMDKYKYFPKQLCNFIRLRRNENKSTTFSTNSHPEDDLKPRYGDEFFSLMKKRIIPFEMSQRTDLRGKK